MKKKMELKSFVAGILVTAMVLILAMPVSAALTRKAISVYSGLNVYIDDVRLTPKDVNGKTVDIFAYDGTTYLPIRAISEALGKNVEYDNKTQSVYVGKHGQVNMLDVCPPYHTKGFSVTGDVSVAGRKYTTALTTNDWDGYALFNLNGDYDKFTFTVGHIDGTADRTSKLKIYLDGDLALSTDLDPKEYPKTFTINTTDVLQMNIQYDRDVDFANAKYYALVDLELE